MWSIQEWLKKKKDLLRENMQQKKKVEEMLQEKKRRVNNLHTASNILQHGHLQYVQTDHDPPNNRIKRPKRKTLLHHMQLGKKRKQKLWKQKPETKKKWSEKSEAPLRRKKKEGSQLNKYVGNLLKWFGKI